MGNVVVFGGRHIYNPVRDILNCQVSISGMLGRASADGMVAVEKRIPTEAAFTYLGNTLDSAWTSVEDAQRAIRPFTVDELTTVFEELGSATDLARRAGTQLAGGSAQFDVGRFARHLDRASELLQSKLGPHPGPIESPPNFSRTWTYHGAH